MRKTKEEVDRKDEKRAYLNIGAAASKSKQQFRNKGCFERLQHKVRGRIGTGYASFFHFLIIIIIYI